MKEDYTLNSAKSSEDELNDYNVVDRRTIIWDARIIMPTQIGVWQRKSSGEEKCIIGLCQGCFTVV